MRRERAGEKGRDGEIKKEIRGGEETGGSRRE